MTGKHRKERHPLNGAFILRRDGSRYGNVCAVLFGNRATRQDVREAQGD